MLLAIGRMVAEKSMIAWPLQSIFILSILYSRDINNHETPPGPRDKIPRSISSEYTQITFLYVRISFLQSLKSNQNFQLIFTRYHSQRIFDYEISSKYL